MQGHFLKTGCSYVARLLQLSGTQTGADAGHALRGAPRRALLAPAQRRIFETI